MSTLPSASTKGAHTSLQTGRPIWAHCPHTRAHCPHAPHLPEGRSASFGSWQRSQRQTTKGFSCSKRCADFTTDYQQGACLLSLSSLFCMTTKILRTQKLLSDSGDWKLGNWKPSQPDGFSPSATCRDEPHKGPPETEASGSWSDTPVPQARSVTSRTSHRTRDLRNTS